ncbi:MAG TPA: hypothetical protein VK843_01170 [Planctomycetota bacterium]|nr:hypothetical protein [Planctomycetota bacterium]
MILDARTIALLFVDGLSGLLLLLLVWIALRSRLGTRGAADLEGLWSLLALAMGALFFLRLVAWVTFFLVLDGYVPGLRPNGVMCAFGVVQLVPELARFALWAKPVAVGCLCLWWSLSLAERFGGSAAFQKLRFALVLPIAAIAGVELGAEVRWLLADKLDHAVTCCSAALDLTRNADWFKSTQVFGLGGSSVLMLLFASKAALIGACAFIARRKPDPRLAWTIALCASATAIAVLDLDAWREVIAPRALGLEFHRCAYELVTRSIALGPAALLATLAHLALFALPLYALLRSREPEGVRQAGAWIASVAALAIASEQIALAVHSF